jgi:hypothetical protein
LVPLDQRLPPGRLIPWLLLGRLTPWRPVVLAHPLHPLGLSVRSGLWHPLGLSVRSGLWRPSTLSVQSDLWHRLIRWFHQAHLFPLDLLPPSIPLIRLGRLRRLVLLVQWFLPGPLLLWLPPGRLRQLLPPGRLTPWRPVVLAHPLGLSVRSGLWHPSALSVQSDLSHPLIRWFHQAHLFLPDLLAPSSPSIRLIRLGRWLQLVLLDQRLLQGRLILWLLPGRLLPWRPVDLARRLAPLVQSRRSRRLLRWCR